MKYLSLALLIISILTGVTTAVSASTSPFTEGLELYCREQEVVFLDKTFDVSASAYPYGSESAYLTWESSDENIATVKAYGEHNNDAKITPKQLGKVTITVTTKNDIKKSFQLTVVPRPVSSLSISSNCPYTVILTGSEYKATVDVLPETATDKSLVWTTTDEDIISVDQEGNFRAEGEGTATITATSVNNKTASLTFTVQDEIELNRIILPTSYIDLSLGYSTTLSYTLSPGNATGVTLSFSSSADDIVSVDQNGKITAKAVGSANITITSNNGKTAVVSVRVPRVAATFFLIGVIKDRFKVGDTYQLSYVLKPSNTTDKITWVSSDPTKVSVDANGKITILQEFTFDVRITGSVGGYSDVAYIFYDVSI